LLLRQNIRLLLAVYNENILVAHVVLCAE